MEKDKKEIPEKEIVGYTETYSYFNGKFLGKQKKYFLNLQCI